MSTTTTSSVSVNGEFDTRVHHRSEVKESERTEPVAPIPEFQEETVEVIQLSPQERVSVDEARPPGFDSDLAESSDEASSEEAKRPRHWSTLEQKTLGQKTWSPRRLVLG